MSREPGAREPVANGPDAPAARRAPLRRVPLAVGVAAALVCFAGFWELAEEFATSSWVMAFDARVAAFVIAWRTPATTLLARGVTTTGGTLVVTLLTTLLVAVLWRRRHVFAVSAVVAVAGGALMANLMKDRFGRIRPPAADALVALPGSLSFPSGHSMASLCFAGALTYLTIRSSMRPGAKVTAIAGLALWVIAVGTSRIYLGVHWPSDVAASWLLGMGWLSLIIGYSEARRTVPTA